MSKRTLAIITEHKYAYYYISAFSKNNRIVVLSAYNVLQRKEDNLIILIAILT